MILENILRRCKDKGITVRELEAACGLGNRTIYHWRESAPSISKLKAVASYFDCTVDELIND